MSKYFEFQVGMEVMCPSRYKDDVLTVHSVRGIVDRRGQDMAMHNQIITLRRPDGHVDPITLSGYYLLPLRKISQDGSKSTLYVFENEGRVVLLFKNEKENEARVVCWSYPTELVLAFETLESGKVGEKREFAYIQSGSSSKPNIDIAGHLEVGAEKSLLLLKCIVFVEVELYRYEVTVKMKDLKEIIVLLKKYFRK